MTNQSTIRRDTLSAAATPAGSPPENYERFFVPVIGRPLAADLVEEAGLRPGERVLDAACGTGVVARLAAERVGASGSVAAVDVNPGMLAVARAQAPADAPIRWYETNAESMPLSDEAFDVAFCQVGLQFMADPEAALREMRRVLVPGGRLLVNAPVAGPFFAVLDDALLRHAGEAASGFIKAVFSMDAARLERLIRDAGFREISVRTEPKSLNFPPGREFVWQYVYSTPIAPLIARLDDDRKRAIERDVVAGWAPWTERSGMTFAQEILVGTASR